MIAHFYILPESFENNAQYSIQEIDQKIRGLSEDIKLINKYSDENILYVNYDIIYPITFYSTYTVFDFICKPTFVKSMGIDRDIINAFQKIFDKAKETKYSSAEFKADVKVLNDRNNRYGIVAFHKINNIDESMQIIYGLDQWYKFRRMCLQIEPGTEEFFIDECKKYFPNLYFHERVKITIKDIFKNCQSRIISHLSGLNDSLPSYLMDTTAVRHIRLKKFSQGTDEIDEIATLQGNPKKKAKLTFIFKNNKNIDTKVYCEPHLKLPYDDLGNPSNYTNHRRIYFFEGQSDIENGKILIGHIGKHL